MAIISIGQGYESTEECQDYQTEIGATYRGWGLSMEMRKSNENFKDGKPECFNCEIYRHITRDCKKQKKEKDTQKCYECGRIEHIARDCKTKQKIKKWSVQEEKNTDSKEEDK